MTLLTTKECFHTQIYEGWMIGIFTNLPCRFGYIVSNNGSGFEAKDYATQEDALTAAIAYIDAERRFLAGWNAWVQGEVLPEGADPEFIEGWTESSWAGARVA